MEGVIAIVMVFGMPVFIVGIRAWMKIREQELALRAKGEPVRLEAAAKERQQLEARLQNLESIVCSVDFELNQRLNRLAASTSQMLPAPQPPPSPATAPTQHLLEPLRAGQLVLGRYTIERELGRGGMGAVYLAHDAKLGERVALKTIAMVLAGDPADLADRFRREVQAARRVTHPNVIRIHDLGEDGPLLFLCMEYIEGETLWSRIQRFGQLPVADARGILAEVAAGVAAAHAVGVVHRDLKPQNVLLGGTSGRAVKVIDFGLAKTSFMSGMTATGLILGTPEYMAPEQIRGAHVDARTDVYALGVMAYCALCGRPPFTGPTHIAVGFAHVNDLPRPPREVRPEIPPALEGAILRALAKDPAARFVDAADWARALA